MDYETAICDDKNILKRNSDPALTTRSKGCVIAQPLSAGVILPPRRSDMTKPAPGTSGEDPISRALADVVVEVLKNPPSAKNQK